MYFSDIFKVSPEVMEEENVFDISLISDMPLFIDPFLIFYSKKPEYQVLHAFIVNYVKFLAAKCNGIGSLSEHQIREYFHFKEVRQNWLGFSVGSNQGHGLGGRFASGATSGLTGPIKDFGKEDISKGSHIERMFLFTSGTGRDGLSDFVTNLCKDFLLRFTESFAARYVDPSQRMEMRITRAVFNFSDERWEERTYELPVHRTEYVLLTPMDLLTQAVPWINRPDLFAEIGGIAETMPDAHLRGRLNDFLMQKLAQPPGFPSNKFYRPTAQQKKEAHAAMLLRTCFKIRRCAVPVGDSSNQSLQYT